MADQDIKVQITAEDMFTAVMNGIEQGMKNFQKSIEGLGPVAKKAGDAINAAFNTLGVKSSASIKAEEASITRAFYTIQQSGTASANEIKQAHAAMQEKLKQLGPVAQQAGEAGAKSLGSMLPSLRAIPLLFNQSLQMVETFARALMQLAGPAMAMEKLNAQFLAATGSSELAAKDLDYIREVSNRMGLSFQDAAGSFAKFAASTRNTAIEGAKAKEVFEGVAIASTALRLSTDETNGILLAFSQMIGKGKISAEELNQVAERMPGALDVMARSVGMTGAEFKKAAEAGNIMATDLMNKVGPALKSLYGDAARQASNGAVAQLNRLKTAVFELGAAIGSGPMKIVGVFAAGLTILAEAAKSALDWLGSGSPWAAGLRSIGEGIAILTIGLAGSAIIWGVWTAATSAAAAATWAFTAALFANPVTPLLLAISAAAVGLVAGLSALTKMFEGNSKSAKDNSGALKENTEASRKAAAERKQIEDDYEKALGISLDRQIKKRGDQYVKDKETLRKKLALDQKDVEGNEEAKAAILERWSGEAVRLEQDYFTEIADMRRKDVDSRQKAAEAGETAHINMLKLLGREEEAASLKIGQENRKRRADLDAYYRNRIEQAKASGQVLVGIEGEIEQAKAALEKQFMREASERGREEQKAAIERVTVRADKEIDQIHRKVEEGVLTSRQGEEIITRLTVAAARDQYEARKQMFDRVSTEYDKNSTEYKTSLTDMERAHKQYTDANLAAYKKYGDEIKAIDKEIADNRLSIEQKIADLKQKGMSEDQKHADNLRRFNEAQSKAQEAFAKGDLDAALKFNKQSEELVGRLADKKLQTGEEIQKIEEERRKRLIALDQQASTTSTDADKKTAERAKINLEYDEKRAEKLKEQALIQENIKTGEESYNKVLAMGEQIHNARKQSLEESRAKLKEIQDTPLDPKNLVVNMDNGALGAVRNTLAGLVKTETKTIIIKTVQQDGSSSYKGYFGGGKVASGSPLRDSVNAILAKNEWVINNHATGFWGDGIMSAINSPLSAAGRRLQEMISGPSLAGVGGQNMGTINLQIGGEAYPVQGKINVLSELATAVRRLRKAGIQ